MDTDNLIKCAIRCVVVHKSTTDGVIRSVRCRVQPNHLPIRYLGCVLYKSLLGES